MLPINRRTYLQLLAGWAAIGTQAQTQDTPAVDDWTCPMDPDVHLNKPGKCPRCGMKLTLHVPDRVEFPMEVTQSPELLRPGQTAALTFRIIDPSTNRPTKHFDIVHEKLMHLFLVSENLQFFAHVHPVLQDDGSFKLNVSLPEPGMYRLLADFYPSGSTPQLAVNTLFVTGQSKPAPLSASLAPSQASNLTASLKLEPEQPLAGLETRLVYDLAPADKLELYLGAWAHMLMASSDLVDLLHIHPVIATGDSRMQFNIVFPRSGLYRIWTQFQRAGVVNTTVFTVPVKEL